MPEQEALEILKISLPFVASKEVNKAVEKAVEALEKQIAKKPVGLKKNICPNCSWGIVMTTQKYCDECGQKLDR